MRLLHLNKTGTISLTKDLIDDIPSYAILSHTWGADEEEVTFDDVANGSGYAKAGYAKIKFCAERAREDGLKHFWIDTCCIDKTNHVELSEAIVSMFAWYRDAVKCYVFLSDVSYETCTDDKAQPVWMPAFQKSRYFSRGWTLQELIAPKLVEFYSRDGYRLGDKRTLESIVQETTTIPIKALRGDLMSSFGVEERLQWAVNRSTKRKEDKAYCLLGIFDVFMPLMYGEGDNAFDRLLRKIAKRPKTVATGYQGDPAHSGDKSFASDSEVTQKHAVCCGTPNFKREIFSRSDELDLIHLKFTPVSDNQERLVLCGLPGMGKTAIALQYLQLHLHTYEVVIWIEASSLENAQRSFGEAVAEIKRHGYSLEPAEALPLDESHSVLNVINWLEISCQNWLLILNGLDDLDLVDVHVYLPQCRHGKILVTSRLSSTAGALHATAIPIGPLTLDGATELLLSRLTSDYSCLTGKADAEAVVKKLSCVALAVEQAGALIAKTGIGFDDFLDQYTENYKYIAAEKPARSEWGYDRNLSIWATFETLLNHKKFREEPTHRRFLTLLSFLGPGEVPINVICQETTISKSNVCNAGLVSSSMALASSIYVDLCLWYQQISKPKNILLRLSIQHLEDLSLVHVTRFPSREIKSMSLNGALSTWLMNSLHQDEKIAWTIFAASLSCANLPDTPEEGLAPILGTFGSQKSHVFSFVRQNIDQKLVATFDNVLLYPYGVVMRKLAYHLSRSRDSSHAEEAVTRAIEYEMHLQGRDWPMNEGSLRLLNILGDIYWKSERLDDAETLFEDLLESCEKLLGNESEFTLAIWIKIRHIREQIVHRQESMERAVQATTHTKRDSDAPISASNSAVLQGRSPVIAQPNLPLGRTRATYNPLNHLYSHAPSDDSYQSLPGYSLSGHAATDNLGNHQVDLSWEYNDEDLFHFVRIGNYLQGRRLFQRAIPMYLKLWPRGLHYRQSFEEAAVRLNQKELRFEALVGLLKCYKDYGVLTTAAYSPLMFPIYAAFHHSYHAAVDFLYALVQEDVTHEFRHRIFAASVEVECFIMLLHFRRTRYEFRTDFQHDIRLWISADPSRHHDYLTFAAGQGDTRLLQTLLRAGVDANACRESAPTALYKASERGDLEVVQILLEAGAGLYVTDERHHDPLVAAASGGYMEVVQSLLAHKGDSNISYNSYRRALFATTSRGHMGITEVLLRQDEIMKTRAIFHWNDLISAATRGYEHTVKMIIDCGLHPETDPGAFTCALSNVVFEGRERMVELLINGGANVNADETQKFWNPLLAASLVGCESIVKILLDAGADPNSPFGLFGGALRAASERGHAKVVELLLDRGSDVNARCGDDKNYGIALWAAARQGRKEVVEILLKHGADINAQYYCYGTALEVASKAKHEEVVALLLEHGAAPIADTNR